MISKNIPPNVMIYGKFPKSSLDHVLGAFFLAK
jgi:hypothetical protein